MPAGKLNAKQLDRLTAQGSPHNDGGGLFFVVTPSGRQSWMIQFRQGARRLEFTVGAYPAMSLSQARDKATIARNDVLQNVDPRDRYSVGDMDHTFEKLARKYIPIWIADKNKRAADRWEKMLADCKAIGPIPVAALTKQQVLDVLTPHWMEKPLTAQTYQRMIKKVMDVAIDDDLRKHANPAVWKGSLELKLPKPRDMLFKLTGTKRRRRVSLPFDELPDFIQKIAYDPAMAARAVEFAILTGGRSQEVYKAEWSMVDVRRRLLNIPARLMGKVKQPHTVLLCDEAIALLESLPRRSKYIFPSDQERPERGEEDHMDSNTLLFAARRVGMRVNGEEIDLHGFRSTFRNFAAAETDASFETAETAIAHLVGNDTTRAYLNDPVFKKRAKLMAEWGAFAFSKRPKGDTGTGNVVALRKPVAA